MVIGRRAFLSGALATPLLTGSRAFAIGKRSKFRIAQLDLGGNWNPRPNALRRLGLEVEKRTSIAVNADPIAVKPVQKELFKTPFLYLAGDREFPLPTKSALDAIKKYLTFGGFLFIDSAEGTPDGAFDGSVRQLLSTLFPPPSKSLELVRRSHVVYKSFFLIDKPVGRLSVSASMEGVFRDGRMMVAYSSNDLGGAWSRDEFGNYDFVCTPGGERQRTMAFRLGVNLVMYALCLDYKDDQVHVPEIMKRRTWRPNDGAEDLQRSLWPGSQQNRAPQSPGTRGKSRDKPWKK